MDDPYESFEDLLGQENWLQPNLPSANTSDQIWTSPSEQFSDLFGGLPVQHDLHDSHAQKKTGASTSQNFLPGFPVENDFLNGYGPVLCHDIEPTWGSLLQNGPINSAQWNTSSPGPVSALESGSLAYPTQSWTDVFQPYDMSFNEHAHVIQDAKILTASSLDYAATSQAISDSPELAAGVAAENDYDELAEDGINESKELVLNLSRRMIYLRATCATCEGPLDTKELLLKYTTYNLYCTRSKAADHPPLICDSAGCGEKFQTLAELENHSVKYDHKSFCCAVPGCNERLPWRCFYAVCHFWEKHGSFKFSCAQCGLVFDYEANLDKHGGETMHAAYVCKYPDCGSESTRIADLVRHQLTHKTNVPRHPCPHCRSYRGNNGFKRKDHLRQHIRNYHRIEDLGTSGALFWCHDKDCAKLSFGEALRLNTPQELTDHMLQRHSSSAYVCKIPGCDRILMNGFETDKLLKTHVKKTHPSEFQCGYPGCDRVGTKGWMRERDMVKHMKKAHGISE